ncbi:SPOR domain-containing protein [Verticiella alkaliphila]|uniref:SPOR domain-containing protein n=1 Tax=Verticiella alkaliphila TaxID=2779529 RepID=UPI003530339B
MLLATRTASREQADAVVQQITQAGFAPYVQGVRAENPYWQVYIRVARDAATTDAAVNALRQMGFAPELLVRP